MPLTPQQRAREIDRHLARKAAIAAKYSAWRDRILDTEGFGASVIAIIVTCLEVIVVLLAVPDPSISKIAAILLTLGLGFFLIAVIVYALIASKSELIDAGEVRDQEENEEDVLHRVNLEG
jgi:hypothetical protein